MIEGKGFLIIEAGDIADARDHFGRISLELKNMIDAAAPEIDDTTSAQGVTVDIFVLTAAARVAEEISKRQGGLVVMEEGAPKSARNAAAAALELLRQQGDQTHEATEGGLRP